LKNILSQQGHLLNRKWHAKDSFEGPLCIWLKEIWWHTPHSLKDSNVSSKFKTMEKGVGVRSLTHSTSRVKGCAKTPGWKLRQMKMNQLFMWTYTNKQQVG